MIEARSPRSGPVFQPLLDLATAVADLLHGILDLGLRHALLAGLVADLVVLACCDAARSWARPRDVCSFDMVISLAFEIGHAEPRRA